jgi:hypothetical protein
MNTPEPRYTIHGVPPAERTDAQALADLKLAFAFGLPMLDTTTNVPVKVIIVGSNNNALVGFPNGVKCYRGDLLLIPVCKNWEEYPFDLPFWQMQEAGLKANGQTVEWAMGKAQKGYAAIGKAEFHDYMEEGMGDSDWALDKILAYMRSGYPLHGLFATWATVEVAEPETPETEAQ